MLTVFGSTALDTIRTPKKVLKNVLGGAATFAAISASNFVNTGLIAVVGKDFPKEDLKGFTVKEGKTFRYDGRFDNTLSTRETLKTELNVLEDFKPSVPEEYKKSQFVYLANNDPDQNTNLIKEFDKVKFSMCDTIDFWSMCDTIDFWISTKRESVIKMIKAVDAVVINDEEAKLLTKEFNLIKCAKKIMNWGAKYVIIKKGEHGSLMFFDDVIFPSAGFSLEDVVDPTGAGDSFAGAMIGYLASKRSTSLSDIKKAVIYGNVLGSFAVEEYGLGGLLQLKKSDITKRMKLYEKMIRF
jgi:sugar/nucleoside kinase (ribokinase family)